MQLDDITRMKAVETVVAHHMGQPFEWGVRDCAIVAADAVQSLTQVPVLDPWPTYTTQRGALRVIRRLGHASFIEAVTANLTRFPDGNRSRRIGDIVGMPSSDPDFGPTLGVYLGGTAVLVSAQGWFIRGHIKSTTGEHWGLRDA